MIFPPREKFPGERERNLGEGYYVYGKIIQSNKFQRLNQVPVTKTRAMDIGSFYVDQTLARTFKVEKAGAKAKEDMTFGYIPMGYYQSISKKIRGFKIRKGQAVDVGMQFIEKNMGIADTQMEKQQLAYFRKLERQILK